MFERILRHAYLPLVDRHKGIRYAQWLEAAERTQYLPIELSRRAQLDKLRDVVAHAARHCPLYTERFRDAGVTAEDIRSPEDIRRLPLLTKQDVRDHAARLKSEVYAGRAFPAVTSGSTGVSLKFEQDSAQEGWTFVCIDRAHRWWGVQRWDRKVIMWGRPVAGGPWAQAKAWTKARARNSLHFNMFMDLDDDYLGRIARAVESFGPRFLYAYGSSLGALADYMDRHGIALRGPNRPAFVEYTGDSIYTREKEIAERVFGAPAISLYGSSEVGALGCTCPRGKMHISIDHAFIEFLREDGTTAAPGEQAEIVVTTLNNTRMPLIRYRLGDLGSYSTEECTCGVRLPIMNLEVGKLVDRITTSAKKDVSAYVLDYINKQALRSDMLGIRQFLVEQTAFDDFILHVVKDEPFESRTIEFFESKMREYLGEQIRVTVNFTASIGTSASGKRRWFKKSGDWATA